MFSPTAGKLTPFYFICRFTIPQTLLLFAYFTYTRQEDTGVCKQTEGEYYSAVNLNLYRAFGLLQPFCVYLHCLV